MRIPVDTSAVSFVSAGPPEAAVDFDTKVQKTDDKGLPIIAVHLFVVGAGTREVITVKVAGDIKGLGDFTPVKVTDWGKERTPFHWAEHPVVTIHPESGRKALYLTFVPPVTFDMVGPGQGYNDVLFTRHGGRVRHVDALR